MISATRPLIYLISDGTITNENFNARSDKLLSLVEAAVRTRIPLVQIREKQLSTKKQLILAGRISAITRGSKTRVLINDRLDIALATGLDGVHLTSSSVGADVIRGVVGKGFVIGASVHSSDELVRARATGADLAVFAPIYETPGKGRGVGVAILRDAVATVAPFPVLALGGIDHSNYKSVIDAGAAGFAAIRFLNNAANLEKLSIEFGL